MEEVESILGIKKKMWKCTQCGEVNNADDTKCEKCGAPHVNGNIDTNAENNLNIISKILLVIGLIIGTFLFLASLVKFGKGYDNNSEIGVYLLLMAISIILFVLLTYFFLKVICNISVTLKHLHKHISKNQ